MANLSDLSIKNSTIEVNGSTYIVTRDTGEMSYGYEYGGGAAFAYDAEEVEDMDQPESYQDFCDEASPISPAHPDWLDLAVAMARRGDRLTIAGSCSAALTEREYTLVRLAAQQERDEA